MSLCHNYTFSINRKTYEASLTIVPYTRNWSFVTKQDTTKFKRVTITATVIWNENTNWIWCNLGYNLGILNRTNLLCPWLLEWQLRKYGASFYSLDDTEGEQMHCTTSGCQSLDGSCYYGWALRLKQLASVWPLFSSLGTCQKQKEGSKRFKTQPKTTSVAVTRTRNLNDINNKRSLLLRGSLQYFSELQHGDEYGSKGWTDVQ